MKSGIYKITDLRNGKIYIGRASDLRTRKWRHFCFIHPQDYTETSLKTEKNMKIHLAMIESQNEQDFDFQVLEYCDIDKLDEREQYYIKLYNSRYPNGYNSTDGGCTFPHQRGEEHYNSKITNEEAELIKQMLINKYNTDEIQKLIPQVTIGMISSINNGHSWYDATLKYPLSRLNGVIKYTDEDILNIRQLRLAGMKVQDIANLYNTNTSTISDLTTGKSHQNIKEYISLKKHHIFSDDEVVILRQKHFLDGISMNQLREEYNRTHNRQVSRDAFNDMINGDSYSCLPNFGIKKKQTDRDQLINRAKQAKELKEKNYSIKDIAKILNCSVRTVYRDLKKDV